MMIDGLRAYPRTVSEGGQAQFAPQTTQIEPVPDGFGISSKSNCLCHWLPLHRPNLIDGKQRGPARQRSRPDVQRQHDDRRPRRGRRNSRRRPHLESCAHDDDDNGRADWTIWPDRWSARTTSKGVPRILAPRRDVYLEYVLNWFEADARLRPITTE